ncbi:hypothetical protein LENED_001539 [Lentinula edodes]|uniref:Uncharacterized protein n=1 Tax=Lentinula edodes TaxID=5353 RepID=A0A1Q3DYG2_LENED|nr:hypothetical protein LENED_001539 [Lentinula edodes]
MPSCLERKNCISIIITKKTINFDIMVKKSLSRVGQMEKSAALKHKDDLLREVQVTREELVAKHNELQIILKKQEISELEAELNANKLRIGSMDRLFEP